MRKKLLTALLCVAAALCLCFGLAACGGGGFGVEGKYYLVEQNKYDMQTYFTLKGGKWTDEDGISGDYETDGEKITLFTDMFGQKMEFMSGTVKDGVLDLKIGGDTKIFAKEDAWKGTSGGSQTPSSKEYTVTYDANGGAFAGGGDTSSQVVKEGVKLTAPTSPTRSNYTFAGWAKSKNGSTMWKFDEDTVSENTTLYAQWSQESAVILSVEGASIEDREIFMLVDRSTGSVSLSGKIVCSDDSIWRLYSDPEGQREIPTKMVTNLSNGNNTYYIVVNSQNQAQVNVYQLTVHRSYRVLVSYYNGESLLKTEETYTGDKFTANYKPDITGYTFNKWKTVSGKEFTADVLWGATSLYADKTANTYKATLNVNGGDALTETEKTMTYDKTYSFPVPRRTGYSFVGWYVGYTQITNANGSSLSAWQYAGAQSVTAHWQANNYAVTLKQNDNEAGTVSGGGDHAYDSQVTITATTNKGYNFLGWYDKDDEIVSDKAQYTFKMGFAVSYTAKWDYYTLTTTRNNTSAGTISKYYTDEKVSVGTKVALTAITNRGYTFVGWYKGDDEVSKDLIYQYTMTKEDVAFEARWSLDPAMADFNFTSTPTTCTLTGVNNKSKSEYIVPDYVTKIMGGTFSGCSSMQSLTIPFVGESRKTSSDTYQDPFGYIFGGTSFNGASAVTQYYYGYSTSSTTYSTYYIPNSLKSVTVTGGEILYGAFYNCSGLTSVTIGNGVTSIGSYAFRDCDGLTSIEIPDNVKSIGNGAFYKCSGLTSVTIGSGVTEIGWSTFEDCSGLTNITIPESVRLIYGSAFSGCSGLTSVTIGNGVTQIGGSAFYNCSGLTSVTIGSSVTSIGDIAFSGCYKLIEVWNYSQLKFIEGESGYGYIAYYAKHVYTEETPSKQTVKDDYLFYEEGDEAYLLGYMGEDTELALPTASPSGKNYKIWQYAFYYCSGLMSVTIGSGVASIRSSAFKYCSGLESVTIGDGVTSIGSSAFYNCSGLESVIWNAENCTTAGSYDYPIFKGCTSFKTVTFGDNVKIIPAYAFYDCNQLTNVTISDSVKSIGNHAFYGCSGLTSITIPDSVTSIGYRAFYHCSGLTSVTIGSGVSSIGSLAFEYCSGLKGVYVTNLAAWCRIEFEISSNYVSSNPLSYAQHLYLDNVEVKDLIIPAGITEIKDIAFWNCSGLTSVTIGSGVTSIGEWAFGRCTGMTSITIPDSVTSIGSEAFYNCSGLTSVYYKGTPTEWSGIQIGDYNSHLTSAKRYYYSDQTPTEEQWQKSKNWWHYDEDGETIILWTKEA